MSHDVTTMIEGRQAATIDAMLLLEGTYPYVRGGVSSWVHQLLSDLPDVRFGLLFLGSTRSQYGQPQYQMPDNVVHLEEHFLMENLPRQRPRPCKGNYDYTNDVLKLLQWFRSGNTDCEEALKRALGLLGADDGMSAEDFLGSEAAWDFIRTQFESNCPHASFVNYFWTIRSMHLPLLVLSQAARHAPPAKMYHAISTGYAGCLGAMLNWRTGAPLVLTEHGIYTKERKIDLQSMFAKSREVDLTGAMETSLDYDKQLWMRFFEGLGRLTYHCSGKIISLYGRNRDRQVRDGADMARTEVIPNGVHVEQFLTARNQRRPQAAVPRVLGLIGRVVPIKDIKTFIRSMRVVVAQMPDAEGWLIGPEEEDPAYVDECRRVIKSLGLDDNIRFLGFQKPDEILPKLGLLMLTSISEAFPLVIVEAYACGVPVVATDVGACREIIEGRTEEDRALGAAGIVVPIADPNATAQAALDLLTDSGRWEAARTAGMRRVETYYERTAVFKRYRQIYRDVGIS